jgi:hypothetical protein
MSKIVRHDVNEEDVRKRVDGFGKLIPKAIAAAVICRETGLLDVLTHVPVELMRRSTTRALEDSFLYAEALGAYGRGDTVAAWDKGQAALLAAQTEILPPPTVEVTREVTIPMTEVFLRLVEGAGEGRPPTPFRVLRGGLLCGRTRTPWG